MVFRKEMYYNIESVRMHAYYIHKRYVCLQNNICLLLRKDFYISIKDRLNASVLNEQIELFANLVSVTYETERKRVRREI